MQVMLDGRRFPPAEGPNKKVAKKDAAAITMKILLKETEGAGDGEEEELSIEGAESTTDLADDMLVCLFLVFSVKVALNLIILISHSSFEVLCYLQLYI